MKNKILSLVMLASATAPLVAVVSCGGDDETREHSKTGVHNTTQQNTNTQTTGTTSGGSGTSNTGTSTGSLTTGTSTGTTTGTPQPSNNPSGTSNTGVQTITSGTGTSTLTGGTLTSGDVDSATSTLTTGFNSIVSGLGNVGTSSSGSSSSSTGGTGTTITGSTGSGSSGVGTPPPSSGTSGTITTTSGSGSSGTPTSGNPIPTPHFTQPPSGNIALGSIADYEANGHSAQVLAKNFQPTTQSAYNIMSHFKLPFAGKSPTGFMVRASDLDSSSFMVTWTKYNRTWNINFFSQSQKYRELKIAELVDKIKNDRTMNLSTNTAPSTDDKKLYIGYMFRRYMDEVWKEQYKDFSKLKAKFPFINVAFKHYDRGTWSSSLFHNREFWNGLMSKDEETSGLMMSDIIARTDLDVYEISIDGHIYKFVFDSAYSIPPILQRKVITDVFIQKQWSYHLLKYEGFLVSPRRLGEGGVAYNFIAKMAPWTDYKNAPAGFWNNSLAYENFDSFFKLEEGIFHEFGHNMTLAANHTKEFAEGSFYTKLTEGYADIYADQQRHEHLAQNMNVAYGRYADVPLREVYGSWDWNHMFVDISTTLANGSFHKYNFTDEAEYTTELSRQFEESNMFENTNFFNGESEYTDSEVARYSSYFENWHHPIWDKNTRTITNEGKAYRDEFNKYVLGFSNDNVVNFTEVKGEYSNWIPRNGLIGSVKEDFDLIKLTDPSDPSMTYTTAKISKLGRNHSNWFVKNRFLSRDDTPIQDGKISFAMAMMGLQNWGIVNRIKVEFFKDANSNGIAESSEKVYSTTISHK